MIVSLLTKQPFEGRLYVKNFAERCDEQGQGSNRTTLRIPLNGKCGVSKVNDFVLSTVVVVQFNPIIQRKGDQAVKMACLFMPENQTVSSVLNFTDE